MNSEWRKGEPYKPDSDAGERLYAAIVGNGSGRSDENRAFAVAGERLGIRRRHLRQIVRGQATFPELPEFIALVCRVLQLPGVSTPLPEAQFPCFDRWAKANPQAAFVARQLASLMAGKYALERRGIEGAPGLRRRLFLALEKHGVPWKERQWGYMLSGKSAFPTDVRSLEAIAAALRDVGCEAVTASAVYGGALPSRRQAADLQTLFALLATDFARFHPEGKASETAKPSNPNADPIRLVTQALSATVAKEGHADVERVRTALRQRADLLDLADRAKVDAVWLALLVLGLKPVEKQGAAKLRRVVRHLPAPPPNPQVITIHL